MSRALHGWLAAEALSLTGTRVSMIALPLFVLEETGSPVRAGVMALAESLPLVVLKVLGGPVVDRVGARRVAVTCDLLSVLAVGAVPLLHHLGALPFGALLVLVALAGALRGPGDGAKQAMVPALVADAGVALERATGLHATVERTSSMLGAALAGLLVAAVGPTTALLVDALSFGVSAVLLLWATARLAPRSHRVEADAGDASYLRQLRDGWDFLRRDPLLLGISVMVALSNLVDAAYVTVLVPVWAVTTGGGASAVGLVFAVFGGAAALGSLAAATWAARLPRYRTYLLAFLVCGAPRYLVLAVDAPLVAVVGVAAVAGVASGFVNPILGAVMFERIPEPLVGRVSSLTTALAFALIPLGGLLGGLLVGGVGLAAALTAAGVAYLAVTVLPALDPRWRGLDERVDVGAAASG